MHSGGVPLQPHNLIIVISAEAWEGGKLESNLHSFLTNRATSNSVLTPCHPALRELSYRMEDCLGMLKAMIDNRNVKVLVVEPSHSVESSKVLSTGCGKSHMIMQEWCQNRPTGMTECFSPLLLLGCVSVRKLIKEVHSEVRKHIWLEVCLKEADFIDSALFDLFVYGSLDDITGKSLVLLPGWTIFVEIHSDSDSRSSSASSFLNLLATSHCFWNPSVPLDLSALPHVLLDPTISRKKRIDWTTSLPAGLTPLDS